MVEAELKILCDSFAYAVLRQLQFLGIEAGKCAPSGSTGLGPASVYLYSLCTFLATVRQIPEESDIRGIFATWAFDEVYGLMIGHPIALETIRLLDADGRQAQIGFELARRDVLAMIEDPRDYRPFGFIEAVSRRNS